MATRGAAAASSQLPAVPTALVTTDRFWYGAGSATSVRRLVVGSINVAFFSDGTSAASRSPLSVFTNAMSLATPPTSFRFTVGKNPLPIALPLASTLGTNCSVTTSWSFASRTPTQAPRVASPGVDGDAGRRQQAACQTRWSAAP